MFEKQFNSFVLSAWLSSMHVCFLTTTMFVFKDNRDNRNNKKNGRNCGCHEVTYNWDNKITVGSFKLHLIF